MKPTQKLTKAEGYKKRQLSLEEIVMFLVASVLLASACYATCVFLNRFKISSRGLNILSGVIILIVFDLFIYFGCEKFTTRERIGQMILSSNFLAPLINILFSYMYLVIFDKAQELSVIKELIKSSNGFVMLITNFVEALGIMPFINLGLIVLWVIFLFFALALWVLDFFGLM